MVCLLKKLLSLKGYEVSASFDGDDGLSKTEELKPDLMILDVRMPGKGGFEVVAEMRRNPGTMQIPVLFLSVVDDEATVAEGLRFGDDYVVKPFKPLELVARIKKILERAEAKAGAPPKAGPTPYGKMAVRLGEETHLVPLKDIYYLEAAGKYCYAYTRDKRWLVGESIGELGSRLGGGERFLRVHRSYIVNVDEASKVTRGSGNKTFLIMSDDAATAIPVSESYLPAVRTRLGI
jgi:DNA-binding LytR/AlgR family response regulator